MLSDLLFPQELTSAKREKKKGFKNNKKRDFEASCCFIGLFIFNRVTGGIGGRRGGEPSQKGTVPCHDICFCRRGLGG